MTTKSYSSEVIHQINEILKDTPIRFDDLNLKYFQHYYAKLMNQIELMNGFGSRPDSHTTIVRP